MINSKRGGLTSTLGKVLLALLFLVFVVVMFFGNEGKLNIAKDKLIDIITGVPEVDQSKIQMDFFRRNDQQLTFLSSWTNDMKYALAGTATTTYGGCIFDLASLEEEGFYLEGANYNLYFDQAGADITISLTRYAKLDTENTQAKTEVPVTTTKLEGAQLCVIEGTSATTFYDEFNDINKGEASPDITKIKPVPVQHILISSGKEEERAKKRAIGYSSKSPKPINETGYIWADFFKKKDKTIIYAVRLIDNGVNYICLFPTHDDFGVSTCGSPDTLNGVKVMQTDCFDGDAGKDSLKYNFENNLIPEYYICSDVAPATTTIKP